MTLPSYAAETKVTVASSQAELRTLMTRYGIQHFGIAEQPGGAMLAFQIGGYAHRIHLPIRDVSHRAFEWTASGRSRDAKGRKAAAAQEQRARWRALVLIVKAKLEYAAIMDQTLETAFTEYRVLGDGRTVQEQVTGEGQVMALTWGES